MVRLTDMVRNYSDGISKKNETREREFYRKIEDVGFDLDRADFIEAMHMIVNLNNNDATSIAINVASSYMKYNRKVGQSYDKWLGFMRPIMGNIKDLPENVRMAIVAIG